MQSLHRNHLSSGGSLKRRLFLASFLVAALLLRGGAAAVDQKPIEPGWQRHFLRRGVAPVSKLAKKGPPEDREEQVSLVVSNQCDGTIWPGIVTQAGTGPGTGGFQLEPGEVEQLWVSPDWQGRVWGRTNCSVNGDASWCETGDCLGKLDCELSGSTPATLAEFTLAGGDGGMQTFYDLSLVDGYNLPMAIKYIPAKNTTFIPPNLTNPACIATSGWIHSRNDTGTYYSNDSYPIPLETFETNDSIRNWCPWKYLAFPPNKPGNGVYPYPDDRIRRSDFSPCNSACSATGSKRDCCEGKYHDPDVCKPSRYSMKIKAICPDAYSFAFDDQKSTFIIPKGGGFEVIMCPKGRSTNILRQLGAELFELASSGRLSSMAVSRLRNASYIEEDRSSAGHSTPISVAIMSVAVVFSLFLI